MTELTMKTKDILDWALDSETTTIPDCDDCIVGLTQDNRLIYNKEKIINKLEVDHSMNEEDALEWFSYNIDSYGDGEGSPIFLCVFTEGLLKKKEPLKTIISKNVGLIFQENL